ncbi:hypothetical protein BDZ89DRAFT_1167212 [Hymenopellis radicata]|nr:hypothetical protein BDZ89DRAFT_1167212 [Hymenopellis radicata]
MPPMVPIPSDIAELTGPLIIGHLFNWGFLGALCIQAYIYYLAFPHDRIWPTKALCTCIFILEVTQVCINTRDAFRNFGLLWGDVLDLDLISTYWLGVPVMAGIVSAIVQFFYAWRLWILTKRYWLPGPIVFLSLTQSISAFWTANAARRINHLSELQTETYVVTSIWLSGTALCDTVIAGAMAWTLLRARTGVRSTDAIVFRIVQLSIETGALCAIFAVFHLVFYVVCMHNNFHLAWGIPLTGMYATGMYANGFFCATQFQAEDSRRELVYGPNLLTLYIFCFCTSHCTPPLQRHVHDLEFSQVCSDARDEAENQNDSKHVMNIASASPDDF